jgi:hypothetical protein
VTVCTDVQSTAGARDGGRPRSAAASGLSVILFRENLKKLVFESGNRHSPSLVRIACAVWFAVGVHQPAQTPTRLAHPTVHARTRLHASTAATLHASNLSRDVLGVVMWCAGVGVPVLSGVEGRDAALVVTPSSPSAPPAVVPWRRTMYPTRHKL